jgi:chemotaxis protein methyltransferase CheR
VTDVLSDADLDYVRDAVHHAAAIVVDASKRYLVESRLGSLARSEGLTIGELVASARRDPFGRHHREIVEAMTTNETSWYRDVHPFEALRTHVLPALVERRRGERALTIWSAACSTGQEPYSIAMTIRDAFPELATWNVRIYATDLSRAAVARAEEGLYSQLEVNRGLPARQLASHFVREGASWRISPTIRSMVHFGVANLIGPWPSMPPADVVMLRNVMIYFDVATKRRLLDRLHGAMRPDGYLFLGNAETTMNLDDRFLRVEPSRAGCYQRRSAVTVDAVVGRSSTTVASSRTPERSPT